MKLKPIGASSEKIKSCTLTVGRDSPVISIFDKSCSPTSSLFAAGNLRGYVKEAIITFDIINEMQYYFMND